MNNDSHDLPSDMSGMLQDHLRDGEVVWRAAYKAPPEWSELLLGERSVVLLPPVNGPDHPEPKVLFPGSFNPLHHGHKRMAEIAAERLGVPVWFEISITNVDKPPLDFLSIRERLDQLAGYGVCLSRAPTFVEKAELFPRATFVVGTDTLVRIADERYYHESAEERDRALARLDQVNTRFLVFGRTYSGRFTTLADLSLPPRLAALCEGVPEADFRDDISSTTLRQASAAENDDR